MKQYNLSWNSFLSFSDARTVQTDCNATLRPLGQRMQRARSMLRCSLFSRFLSQSYGKNPMKTNIYVFSS